MLCVLAELVLNVASVVRMLLGCLSGECHADVPPAGLPGSTSDMEVEEEEAAGSSQPSAVMMMVMEQQSRGLTRNASILSVRVPGEGRGPAITSTLVLPSGRSRMAQQALKPTLDSRPHPEPPRQRRVEGRRGHGSEDLRAI
jgi:hypothetical protein